MRKAIVALAVAAFATTASANIAAGPHDLSTRLGATLSSCQFCHAPHFANASGTFNLIPLWNRNAPTTTTYSFRGTATQLGAGSYSCLSCHDGISDMGMTYSGTQGLPPGPTTIGNTDYANVGATGQGATRTWGGNPDLTDDHPIGRQFTPGSLPTDPMKDLATAQGAGFKLYEYTTGVYTVECGTCHEPHLTGDSAHGGVSLLRNTTTSFCSACHNK
jgi:predicted CXXCH cytochrome family protein